VSSLTATFGFSLNQVGRTVQMLDETLLFQSGCVLKMGVLRRVAVQRLF
jgi:hypothetical protein